MPSKALGFYFSGIGEPLIHKLLTIQIRHISHEFIATRIQLHGLSKFTNTFYCSLNINLLHTGIA